MFEREQPYKTNLKCPITGSDLWYKYTEPYVMDPSTFYYAESDPTLIYERHPFSWNLFRLTSTYSMCGKALRYFKLNDVDNTWSEYLRIPGLDSLVPIETPQDEIDIRVLVARIKKIRSDLDYLEKVENNEIEPLPFLWVYSKQIQVDLVVVKPMSQPTGLLNYTKFVIK